MLVDKFLPLLLEVSPFTRLLCKCRYKDSILVVPLNLCRDHHAITLLFVHANSAEAFQLSFFKFLSQIWTASLSPSMQSAYAFVSQRDSSSSIFVGFLVATADLAPVGNGLASDGTSSPMATAALYICQVAEFFLLDPALRLPENFCLLFFPKNPVIFSGCLGGWGGSLPYPLVLFM